MKRALLTHLQSQVKHRKAGYLAACLREGHPSADGRWLHFTEESHARLRAAFTLPRSTLHAPRSPGLGDLVHKVAGPLGRAVRWPCLKGDGTTDLKPGSPCAKARATLNKVPSPKIITDLLNL